MQASTVVLEPAVPAGTRIMLKASVLSRFERKNRRQESRVAAHAEVQGCCIVEVRCGRCTASTEGTWGLLGLPGATLLMYRGT